MTVHLGLDLGGTNIKVAAIEIRESEPTRTVETAHRPTNAEAGPQAVIDALTETGLETAAKVGTIASVGVGVPGLFDADTGRIELFPNLPGPWNGFPLRDPIQAALGVPTALINDANAFLLAEARMGAGRGHDTLIGITLGTGVGGAVMIDGHIHTGAFGTAGEIAHQIVQPDGPLCGCGNRGCVEPLAMSTTLTRIAGRDDPSEVYARAAEGDEACMSAIDQAARYVGIGLANAVTLLGPSCIVVGGGIATIGAPVLGPIRESLRAHVTLAPVDKIQVVPAELGSLAGSLGAALAGADQLDVLAT